jgi:hypothetical protein
MSALGHSRPSDTPAVIAACPLRPKSGQKRDRLAKSALCQKATLLLIFDPGEGSMRHREHRMTEERPMMIGAAIVSDITKSIEHYRDALGFKVTFQYGKPTSYACLCRDEVALHLLAGHKTKQLPGNGGFSALNLVHMMERSDEPVHQPHSNSEVR